MPEHAFPNGTVSVKLHKRKRLTLVVAREELDALLIERLEIAEHENRILRRKVRELTEQVRIRGADNTREGLVRPDGKPYVCRVRATCANPVVAIRTHEEMGAVPYCADHDRPEMPMSGLVGLADNTRETAVAEGVEPPGPETGPPA